MDYSVKTHKLLVSFGVFKFIYLAKSSTLIIKLLKKLEKNFCECFPDQKAPKFDKITENGYVVPFHYSVSEIFEANAEIHVHEKSSIADNLQEKNYTNTREKEELKKDLVKEIRRDDNKIDENKKREEHKKEETNKDIKIENLPKKKVRHERKKDLDVPTKFSKIDEDRKIGVPNESHKKELLLSSSSEDSDADIFTKDEKKPVLTKSNIFRN